MITFHRIARRLLDERGPSGAVAEAREQLEAAQERGDRMAAIRWGHIRAAVARLAEAERTTGQEKPLAVSCCKV